MKRIFKYISCFIFFVPFYYPTYSQVKLETEGAKFPPTSELSIEDRKTVLASTQELINKYAKVMTLYDKSKGRVTSELVNTFRTLFISNALIERDFEEFLKRQMITPRTYADAIFNRLEGKGFQIELVNAKVKRIENDAAGFWVVVIEANKLRYNSVTSDNKVKSDPGGKPIEQEIRIDFVKGKLDRSKITKIIGTKGGEVEVKDNAIVAEYIRYIGPSMSLYKPSVNTTLSSFWNENHADASLDTKGKLGFSIGVEFATNRLSPRSSSKKNLFLTAGIHYYSYKVTTTMDDFYILPGYSEIASADIGTPITYTRLVGLVSIEEKLSFGVLKIPIGAGYRIYKNKRSAFMLYGKIVPSIIMSSSGDIKGAGTYDGHDPNSMWRLLEEGAADLSLIDQEEGYAGFDVGVEKAIEASANPNKAGFALGFQISPTYYYDFSEYDSTWSLLVGLDLNINAGSFLTHDAADSDIFKRVNDYDSSVLQHYTSDASTFAIGFRIGLQHRLRTDP